MDEALVVLCTFPDEPTARQVTKTLVEEKLAACAQRTSAPIQSVYRWQGELHDDEETLVLLKSTQARWEALVERLTELHPYEVPQIVALPARTSAAYGDWLRDNTTEADPA